MEYCDRSPLAVTAMTTVARAYEMFRKLGLRHLMVLGERGEVVGVITRKDLMVFRILLRKQRELDLIVKMQRTVRHILNNHGWYENGGQERKATKKKYKIDQFRLAWKSKKKWTAMVGRKLVARVGLLEPVVVVGTEGQTVTPKLEIEKERPASF